MDSRNTSPGSNRLAPVRRRTRFGPTGKRADRQTHFQYNHITCIFNPKFFRQPPAFFD
jgi:hypothetical protein